MLKKLFVLIVAIIMFANGVSAIDHSRVFIRSDEVVTSGEYLEIFVALKNEGQIEHEDLSISVVIPELGLFRRFSPYDLNVQSGISKYFDMEISDDTNPGIYDIRVFITNGEYKKIQHSSFEVI